MKTENKKDSGREIRTYGESIQPDMSSEIDRKLIAATRGDSLGMSEVDPADVGDECMDKFDRFDWQSYVPTPVRALWMELPLSSRLVAYIAAKTAAYGDDPSID